MVLFVAGIEGLPIDQDLSTVMITIMKPINSSHPAVQELVGSGYSDAEATTTHSTTRWVIYGIVSAKRNLTHT